MQLLSDEIRSPITKEESTRVYADESGRSLAIRPTGNGHAQTHGKPC